MAGGIEIKGSSGNDLTWETTNGGNIGTTYESSCPQKVFIGSEVHIGKATSGAGDKWINIQHDVSGAPNIGMFGGSGSSFAFVCTGDVMYLSRGGNYVWKGANGEVAFYFAGTTTAISYRFLDDQLVIDNQAVNKNIVFKTEGTNNSTAAQQASILGSDKTAGTGNGGALTFKAGNSNGGTGGVATVTGGNGSAGNASGGDAVVQGGTKSGSGTDGSVRLKTASTDRVTVSAAGTVTIGTSGGSQTHQINGATVSSGSDTLTFTNGPSGTAGNPDIYLKLNINGTDYVFPGFAV